MEHRYEDVTWDRSKRGDKVVLSHGAFGILYAGVLHGQPVAIKAELLDVGDEEAWIRATRLQYAATCPHVVAVHGTIVDRDDDKVTHYTVMERQAGTLTDLLLAPGGAHHGAGMPLRLKLLADVAGGLAYLHAASVIHGDVNPDNVLLTAVSPWAPFPAAKLADFGNSAQRLASAKTLVGTGKRDTLAYMDPRLLDGSASTGGVTAASDAYSFGVLAVHVLGGCHQAAAPATVPLVTALVERGVPPDVVALVQSCWASEQGDRPTMAVVHRALVAASATVAAKAAGGAGGGAPVELQAAPAVVPVLLPAPAAVVPSPAPTPAPAAPAPVTTTERSDKVVLRGHRAGVCCMALLQGGRLASGDWDGTVRLWDVAGGGKAAVVLEGGGGAVNALAVMPGGRYLATGIDTEYGKEGAIVVWDTAVVPPARRAIVDCGSGVVALAVLRDERLAVGCNDGAVRLVGSGVGGMGAVVATLTGHTQAVPALALLPDGTLASGSADTTVRLWDADLQTCFARLAGHTGAIYALAVLASVPLASGAGDAAIRLWGLASCTRVGGLEGHTSGVYALAALPDGRLASGSRDRTVRLWDTRRGAVRAAPLAVMKGHRCAILALQLLPGGRLASSAGAGDKTVRLWPLPACDRIRTQRGGGHTGSSGDSGTSSGSGSRASSSSSHIGSSHTGSTVSSARGSSASSSSKGSGSKK